MKWSQLKEEKYFTGGKVGRGVPSKTGDTGYGATGFRTCLCCI